MNIQDFALHILLSPALADKLAPGRVDDFSFDRLRSPLDASIYPHRAAEIAFATNKTNSWRLPVRRELEQDQRRGELLHFFANHELLAVEAMAYAILKWGAQDAKFCRDTYRILIQEQEHFKLYQERMQLFGVEFGQLPLNDFFWRVISSLEQRQQYLAVMPLTFEQANLDYAKYYEKLFVEISDFESAAIMERIYREEIGHVAHGVRYLLGGKAQDETDEGQWSTYIESLPTHVSPTRAQGPSFDIVGRQKAGLNQRYCDLLRTFGRSFGKPGSLWLYDPGFETGLWHGDKQQAQSKAQNIQHDLCFLMTYLAKAHDMVAVPDQPRLVFLKNLRELGIDLAFYLQLADFAQPPQNIKHPHAKIQSVSRWSARADDAAQSDVQRQLASKVTAWEIAKTVLEGCQEQDLPLIRSEDLGRTVADLDELQQLLQQVKYPILLKEAFNTAGRGNRILWDATGLNDNIKAWLQSVWPRSGTVIAQRFFPKRWDLSLFFKPGQLHRRHGHETRDLKVAITQSSGAYLGHGLGSGFPILPKEIMQSLLAQGKQAFSQLIKEILNRVLDEIAKRFPLWQGPVGIDLMVVWDENEGKAKIFPLNEINPRWTMGAVASAVESLVASKHCALFSIYQKNQLRADVCHIGAHPGFALQTIPDSDAKKISSGHLFLTDPETAERFVAVLHVAKNIKSLQDEILAMLSQTDDRRLLALDAYA